MPTPLEPYRIAPSSALYRPPFPSEADPESTRISRQTDEAFISAYRPLSSTVVDALPSHNVDVQNAAYAFERPPSSTILELHSSSTSTDSVFDSFDFNVPLASPLSQNASTSLEKNLSSPPD